LRTSLNINRAGAVSPAESRNKMDNNFTVINYLQLKKLLEKESSQKLNPAEITRKEKLIEKYEKYMLKNKGDNNA